VLPAKANALLRADRAYQIAAANFYSLRLPEALVQFDSISKDTSSPWQQIAAYMAVRTMLRQAWVDLKAGTKEEYDPATLRQVEPRLSAIISNSKFRTLRKDARRLEALVKFHLYPEQRQHELAHTLHKPDCKIVYYGTAKPKGTTPLLPQFDLSSAEVLNKRGLRVGWR
jgi:hypothetical protein